MEQDLMKIVKDYDKKEGKKKIYYGIAFAIFLLFYLFLRLFNTKYEYEDGMLSLKYSTEWKVEVPAVYDGQTVTGISKIYSGKVPHVRELVIAEGITHVEGINKNSTLRKVVFSSTIEQIGEYAFAWDERLTTLVFPEQMEKTLIIDAGAFGRTDVQEVVLPSGTIEIRNTAFAECDQLTKVQIPSTIEYIGDAAFENATQLSEVVFPEKTDGKLEIGKSAFEMCHIEEIILPEGTTIIDGGAFEYNAACNYIEIPPTVEQIGAGAFSMCGADVITIPEKMQGELTIGEGAFEYNDIEEFIFPEGTVAIGSDVFSHCLNLKRVVFPEEVKEVDLERMFSGCESLEIVKLPKTLGSYVNAYNAFSGCMALSEIQFPEDMLALGIASCLEETKITKEQLPKATFFAKTSEGIYYDTEKENAYISSITGIPVSILEEAVMTDKVWIEGKWYNFPMNYETFIQLDEWEYLGQGIVEKGEDYDTSAVLRHVESGRYLDLLVDLDTMLIWGYQVVEGYYEGSDIVIKDNPCQVVGSGGIVCGLTMECRPGMLSGEYLEEDAMGSVGIFFFPKNQEERVIRVHYDANGIVEQYSWDEW